jgi:DNA-binding MarR family transcriptional regulator
MHLYAGTASLHKGAYAPIWYGIGAMQKPPETDTTDLREPRACNCLAIRQAARQITQLYEGHLAAVGLTASQYSILAKLSRLGPLSINALAAEMVMDRTTTGRAIQPLVRDKLVALAAGSDARMKLVRLTPAGAKRFKAALPHWRAAQHEFERAYGTKEAATLRAALGRASAIS